MTMAPSAAGAQWTEFIPQPYENKAFLEAYSSFERDNTHGNTGNTRWTDTFVREKLTVSSNGYSYHPRFLQYQFSLSGIGRQENYDNNASGAGGWSSRLGLEYDATLFFLPEHPYNLQVYARRFEPVFKEQAATQHSNVETSYGVSFRYRKKPYFFSTSYISSSIDSGETSSDVRRFSLIGEYFKRLQSGSEVSFNGGFNPSWFSNSEGLDGNQMEYLLGNFLNLQRVPWWAVPVRLDSTASKTNFEQDSSSSGTFENDQLFWQERLSAYLPWNFRSDLSYRYQDNESTIPGTGSVPGRTLSNTGKDFQIDVVHRLFQSLDTTYIFLHNTRDSTNGDSTAVSHSLNVNYTKLIPKGRVLAGINASTTDNDNTGQADVVNEPYLAIPVPGVFILRQQNVAPGSIVVLLKSPLPPFEVITLEENVHYTVTPVVSTFEISVYALPSEFVVPGTYDFLVSYSLTTGDFELRTDTYGGNITVELLDNLLAPYFGYMKLSSDVVSGVFPGIPVDSTTYTTGLLCNYGPLQVRGEYQELDWDVSPYEAWRAEVQYVSALNATTNVYAAAAYLNKYYPQGTTYSITGTTVIPSASLTEESETVSGSIQKHLFSRKLSLSVGGSYTHLQGQVDTDAYTVSASLNWRIGKLELMVGANAYASDTSGSTNPSIRRDHELVHVRVRRRLF